MVPLFCSILQYFLLPRDLNCSFHSSSFPPTVMLMGASALIRSWPSLASAAAAHFGQNHASCHCQRLQQALCVPAFVTAVAQQHSVTESIQTAKFLAASRQLTARLRESHSAIDHHALEGLITRMPGCMSIVSATVWLRFVV